MLFVKCVGVVDAEGGYNGFQVIFGASEEGTKLLTFSFPAFLAFLLLIAGIALIWLEMVPFNHFIAAGLLLVSAILLFCFPAFINVAKDGWGQLGKMLDYEARACLIVSGVLTILAAGIVGAKDYLNTLVNKFVK